MSVLTVLMCFPSFQFEEFAAKHPGPPMVTLRREIGHFVVGQIQLGRTALVHRAAASLLTWSTAPTIAFFEFLSAHGGKFDAGITVHAGMPVERARAEL